MVIALFADHQVIRVLNCDARSRIVRRCGHYLRFGWDGRSSNALTVVLAGIIKTV